MANSLDSLPRHEHGWTQGGWGQTIRIDLPAGAMLQRAQLSLTNATFADVDAVIITENNAVIFELEGEELLMLAKFNKESCTDKQLYLPLCDLSAREYDGVLSRSIPLFFGKSYQLEIKWTKKTSSDVPSATLRTWRAGAAEPMRTRTEFKKLAVDTTAAGEKQWKYPTQDQLTFIQEIHFKHSVTDSIQAIEIWKNYGNGQVKIAEWTQDEVRADLDELEHSMQDGYFSVAFNANKYRGSGPMQCVNDLTFKVKMEDAGRIDILSEEMIFN